MLHPCISPGYKAGGGGKALPRILPCRQKADKKDSNACGDGSVRIGRAASDDNRSAAQRRRYMVGVRAGRNRAGLYRADTAVVVQASQPGGVRALHLRGDNALPAVHIPYDTRRMVFKLWLPGDGYCRGDSNNRCGASQIRPRGVLLHLRRRRDSCGRLHRAYRDVFVDNL